MITTNLDGELIPLLHRLGRPDVVEVTIRCLESSLRRNETGSIVSTCASTAGILTAAGRHRGAATAIGAAGTTSLAPTDEEWLSSTRAQVREALGDDRYDELVAAGAAMVRLAVARALVAELRSIAGRPS